MIKRVSKVEGKEKYLTMIKILRTENNFLREKILFLENNHFGNIKGV